jgi:hypothetical protein
MSAYPLHALGGAVAGLAWVSTIRLQCELLVWLGGLFQ